MSYYEVSRKDRDLSIEDPISGYILRIEPGSIPAFREVKFEMIVDQSRHRNRDNLPMILVTARDLPDYHENISNHNINPKLQYLEIGPGLGEFIPYLVSLQTEKSGPKPIAIDIVKYDLMRDILRYSKKFDLEKSVESRVDKLIERCNLLLDPSKINLITNPFEIACIRHPEIERSIDVIISNVAVGHYAPKDRTEYLSHLMRKLIKSNGQILQFEG